MLLFTLGVGSTGMTFMTHWPMIRRLMIAMSLVTVGVTVYQLWRRQHPVQMRVLSGVSVGLSLVLILWSVYKFGL